MFNPQPEHTDLNVYQTVEIGRNLSLSQRASGKLVINVKHMPEDPMQCAQISVLADRDESRKLITALQRWLDTGGFYDPSQKYEQAADGSELCGARVTVKDGDNYE